MLRELLATFGLDFDTDAISGAFDAIDGLVGGVQGLAAAFTDNALVQGVSAFVAEITEAATAVRNVASQVDQSTSTVQEWGFLFQQVGLDIDEVGDVITTLQERARDAADSDDIAKMFEGIGVTVTDANGQLKDSQTLFRETVEGMGNMENATDRAGLALTLFGDNGRRLLPILQEGAAAIDESSEEFRRLGGGLSTEAIMATLELTRAGAKLDLVFESLKSQLAEFLIPAIASVVDSMAEGVNSFREMTEGTRVLEVAFGLAAIAAAAFAINTIIGFLPVIAITAFVALGIVAIIAVIEDLWTAWEGGQSAIGEFIDLMFGAGTTVQIVEGIKNAVEGLKAAFNDLVEFWTSGTGTINQVVLLAQLVWGRVVSRMRQDWADFVSSITDGVGDMLASVGRLASGIGLDSLAESISSAASSVRQAGVAGGSRQPGSTSGSARGGGNVEVNNRAESRNTINVTGPDPETIARLVDERVRESNRGQVRELADNTSRRVQA